MDNIPELPLEPPEDKIVAYCRRCGDEIYEGNAFRVVDGWPVHWDCGQGGKEVIAGEGRTEFETIPGLLP